MLRDTDLHELLIETIEEQNFITGEVRFTGRYRDDISEDPNTVYFSTTRDDAPDIFQLWTSVRPKVGDAVDIYTKTLQDGERKEVIHVTFPDLTYRKLLSRIEELERQLL